MSAALVRRGSRTTAATPEAEVGEHPEPLVLGIALQIWKVKIVVDAEDIRLGRLMFSVTRLHARLEEISIRRWNMVLVVQSAARDMDGLLVDELNSL